MTMVKSTTTRRYLVINCFLIFLLTEMLKGEEEEEKKKKVRPDSFFFFFSNDNDSVACRVRVGGEILSSTVLLFDEQTPRLPCSKTFFERSWNYRLIKISRSFQ